MRFLAAFLLVVLYKFVTNLVQYVKCKRYLRLYKSYIYSSGVNIAEYIPAIEKMFLRAGVKDYALPELQYAGFGKVFEGRLRVVDNLSVPRKDVANAAFRMFSKARGTYKSRMIESLSPLYWVEFIIFFPKNIIVYLGVKPKSVVVKLAQLSWWVLAPLAVVFRDHLYTYVSMLLNELH